MYLDNVMEFGSEQDVKQELSRLLGQLDTVIEHCSAELETLPMREKVKHATALATEFFLPVAACKLAKTICTRMQPLVTNLINMVQEEQVIAEVAGAETIFVKAAQNLQEIGTVATEVINEARFILESFHARLMKNLEPEIAAIKTMFDKKIKGFGEFANKYLKIDYEHILGIELSFDLKGLPKLRGFHHDFMNGIEKTGVIEFANKTIRQAGFYSADLIINRQIFPRKTFFPSHWSREKVISSIYEAYDNFISSGQLAVLSGDGKYKISSIIKEGIEIEMCITRKGKIVTAYPILK